MEEEKTKEQLEKDIEDRRGFIERRLEQETEEILIKPVKTLAQNVLLPPDVLDEFGKRLTRLKVLCRAALLSKEYKRGQEHSDTHLLAFKHEDVGHVGEGQPSAHFNAILGWLEPIGWQFKELAELKTKLDLLVTPAQDAEKERF